MELRYVTLLKATLELLEKIDDSNYGDALAETVIYDGAECDGSCLKDDIKEYLEDQAYL